MLKYCSWRYLRVMYHKIMRNAGSPEYNARGVALGLFIGFLIPIGFQLLVVVPLSFFLKSSKILASIFTFVTNHVSICFIYPLQCYVGSYLLFNPLSYEHLSDKMSSLINSESMMGALKALGELGLELGLSFFVGGLLFGAVSGVIGYIVSLALFRRYKAMRTAQKLKKKIKLQEKQG